MIQLVSFFSFLGCCICIVVAAYTLMRFTQCLNRCKKYINLAVQKLNKRSEHLRSDLSPSNDLNDFNMSAE